MRQSVHSCLEQHGVRDTEYRKKSCDPSKQQRTSTLGDSQSYRVDSVEEGHKEEDFCKPN